MPPTPFSSVDDSEGATISGTDGDAVFKNASNGSTTVNSITPLSTNLGSGVVRIDTSSSKVGINTSPARDLHVNSSSQNINGKNCKFVHVCVCVCDGAQKLAHWKARTQPQAHAGPQTPNQDQNNPRNTQSVPAAHVSPLHERTRAQIITIPLIPPLSSALSTTPRPPRLGGREGPGTHKTAQGRALAPAAAAPPCKLRWNLRAGISAPEAIRL